jgi:dephospho-CoA kinase
MSFTIGLTGGIGSGKSTVAREFEALGIAVVDADAVAHSLTAPGGAAIEPIRAAFGSAFVTPDGALDRAAMRVHVFALPQERQRLEAILHPMIRAETARAADAATSAYRILMIPLLVEAQSRNPHWRARYDRILVIDCDEPAQIARVIRRSGLTADAVRAIMASQAPRQIRLSAADDVFDNSDDTQPLGPRVQKLHEHYLSLARIKALTPSTTTSPAAN